MAGCERLERFTVNSGGPLIYEQTCTVEGILDQIIIQRRLVLQILALFTPGQLVQWGLRNINMAALDKLPHLPEEEGKKKRSNVRPIHISVRHDDDAVITQLVWIEFVFAYSTSQCGHNGANFSRAKHLVKARFLNIQNFAFERKYRLKLSVSPLLG